MSRLALPLALAVLLAACAVAPPTAPPAGSVAAPTLAAAASSPAWGVAAIAQPSSVTEAPTLQPGYFCSPCHPPAQSQLFGVASTRSGFIAVGVQQPPAQAVAFASTDASSWTPLDGFAAPEGTTAIAVTTSAAGRTVVVGSGPHGAAAWSTEDGTAWQTSTAPALDGPRGSTAMTSLVALEGGGFVAGGYRDDPLHATSSGAVWASGDGSAWQLVNAGGVFEGGRIDGVAAKGSTVVGVGTAGDPTYGPAAAWISTAGTWRRATIDGPAGGAMRAVAATSNGFVAVGLNGSDDGAAVWISRDGVSWRSVADQPAFHAAGPIRMLSVASDGDALVATGWRADAGNGSAAAWRSTDGSAWTQDDWLPSFSGGQMAAVAVAGGVAIAVGRTGYPDNNQGTIWTSAR